MDKKKRMSAVFALAAMISSSVVAVQPVLGATEPLGLGNQGISFPDGTVQTTAFLPSSEVLVQGIAEFYVQTLDFCSSSTQLYAVPPDKVLQITWISISFWSFEGFIDPVRFRITTSLAPGEPIHHPLAYLDNMTLVGTEIFPRGSWHSKVDLVSAPGTSVEVSACKNSDAGDMNVRVTFTGRLYDVAP